MRGWVAFLLLTVPPWPATGQSGFGVDRFGLAPASDGLLVSHAPPSSPERLEIMLGSDWAYHLLGERVSADQGLHWIVEHRLSMRMAAVFTPSPLVRLGAGFNAAVHQEGQRLDETGAAVPLGAAMGDSWLSVVWAVPPCLDPPVQAAFATTVHLPTAAPGGLTGSDRVDLRLVFLASARFWLIRPVVNLGVVTRARTRFADLVRDDGILYRAGLEFGDRAWPVRATAELVGETPLERPFGSSANEFLEGLIGLRTGRLGGAECQIGAGFGLAGAGTPLVRAMLVVRWSAPEKRDGSVE